MKNIYITDLDHTFLKNDLSISKYSKNIWNSYVKESLLGVATARSYKKTIHFLDGVEINIPMILLDGSLISTKEKKIIDTQFISKEIADEIIEIGAKIGIYPFILSLAEGELNEVFLHSEILNIFQKSVLTRYTKDDNLQKYKNIKAMKDNFKVVYMGEKVILLQLLESIKYLFGNNLKYILAPEAYVGCYFLTILHINSDKSNAIKSVSEYVGFDLSKLTVFGDNFNDLGMFAMAKTSVAVANAQDGVKNEATISLKHTNNEDGVAKYLEALRNG